MADDVSQETYEEKLAFVASQLRELTAQGALPGVTCYCGRHWSIRYMCRCLYCGEWYCIPCAETHFGLTRAEYRAQWKAAPESPSAAPAATNRKVLPACVARAAATDSV